MAGSSGNKTNSAFNWVEVEVEAELGNNKGIQDKLGNPVILNIGKKKN